MDYEYEQNELSKKKSNLKENIKQESRRDQEKLIEWLTNFKHTSEDIGENIEMKITTRIFFQFIVICLITSFLCTGCAGKSESPEHYILTDYLGSDETAAEAAAAWKKANIFDDVFINNDSNIEIVATKRQVASRIAEEESQFKEEIAEFEKTSGYKLIYSKGFDSITLYAETPEWVVEFGHTLLITVMNSEMIQVLSGNSDWHIKIEIIRPSDEKVLLSQTYPDNQDISFGAYLWDEAEETK